MTISRKILDIIEGSDTTTTGTGPQINNWASGTGVQVGQRTPEDEQRPSQEQGFDTETQDLRDLNDVGRMSQYGAVSYESLGPAYYVTTTGKAKQIKLVGFLRPPGQVTFSRSEAVEKGIRNCRRMSLESFALITLNPSGINDDGTFSMPLRVSHVDIVPYSKNESRNRLGKSILKFTDGHEWADMGEDTFVLRKQMDKELGTDLIPKIWVTVHDGTITHIEGKVLRLHHKYIVALILDPIVDRMMLDRESNFSLGSLSPSLRDEILEKKPELMNRIGKRIHGDPLL